MSNYKYISPTEYGFTKLKSPSKRYKDITGKRARYRKTRYLELFAKKLDDGRTAYKVYYFYRFYVKILAILLFPISILINGVGNTSEVIYDIKSMWNQKKTGSFIVYNFIK